MIRRSSGSGEGELSAVILGGISLLRPLDNSRVPCHLVSLSADDIARSSRRPIAQSLITNITSDPRSAVGELCKISQNFSEMPVLYYGSDVTMRFVSTYRAELSKWFRFLMPSPAVLNACSDKMMFGELVKSTGIDVSTTYSPSESENIGQWARDKLPLVIKPTLSTGKATIAAIAGVRDQKAIFAYTVADVKHVVQQLREAGIEFVIQDLIRGDENQIYSYHAFVDRGFSPLAEFVGRKIRTFPVSAGESSCIELVRDDGVLQSGRDVVRKLKICGPIKLDFKRDVESGRTVLLEANPRFTLWNHLGAVSGVNLPLVAYSYLADRIVEKPTGYKTGVRWISLFNDYRSFRSKCKYRSSALFMYFARNPNRIYHAFAWSDPLPGLLALKEELTRIVRSWMD